MKHIFKYFALVMASVLVMASCTLDVDKTMLSQESEFVTPVLSQHSEVIANEDNVKVESVIFDWSPADFGPDVQIQYSLYAQYGDVVGLIGQTFSTSLSLSKSDFMGVLCVTMKVPKNAKVNISTYVEAAIYKTNTTPLKSTAISYDVTTFVPERRKLSLPGQYQGWDINKTYFWETEGGSNLFKTVVNFANADETDRCYFKVGLFGAWTGYDAIKPSWECPDQTDKNYSVPATESINIITVNTKASTITREAKTFLGIIGDFKESNSWVDDISLVYDPATNVWASPVVTFDSGKGFAIRFNKAWGENKYAFAKTIVASEDITNGFNLVQDGSDNINVPENGNYIIKFYADRTPFVVVMEKQ